MLLRTRFFRKDYILESKNNDGCAIGCGLLIGILVIEYLCIIGLIWLICWCFSPLGLVFDIRLATGAWLILHLIWFCFGRSNK